MKELLNLSIIRRSLSILRFYKIRAKKALEKRIYLNGSANLAALKFAEFENLSENLKFVKQLRFVFYYAALDQIRHDIAVAVGL